MKPLRTGPVRGGRLEKEKGTEGGRKVRTPCLLPTSQQLFDLSAGLRSGELVHDVQSSLAQGVSHSCADPTLNGGGQVKETIKAAESTTLR